MELRPKIGLDEIQFGMKPSQVKQIMGERLVYEDWMGGNINDALYYSGIVLCFNENDSRGPLPDSKLVEMWIHPNMKITYQGKDIYSFNMRGIESELQALDVTYVIRQTGKDIYVKDYGWEISFGKDDSIDRLFLFDMDYYNEQKNDPTNLW